MTRIRNVEPSCVFNEFVAICGDGLRMVGFGEDVVLSEYKAYEPHAHHHDQQLQNVSLVGQEFKSRKAGFTCILYGFNFQLKIYRQNSDDREEALEASVTRSDGVTAMLYILEQEVDENN